MAQTPIPDDAITPPQIPAAEELYNFLMAMIEPDLLTKNLPGLKEKYAGETREQAQARGERYQKAFAEYDRQLHEYLGQLDLQVHGYQRAALQSLEHENREEEDSLLHTLDSQIAQA